MTLVQMHASQSELRTENFPRKTIIHISNVAKDVSAGGSINLQSLDAVMFDSMSRHRNGLAWNVVVPGQSALHVKLDVTRWVRLPGVTQSQIEECITTSYDAPQCRIERSGSYNYRPLARITVLPWKLEKGQLFVADAFTIEASWDEYLYRDNNVLKGLDALNADYRPIGKPAPKASDGYTQALDPSTWYLASQPYLRIKTAVDGIAYVLASDAISVSQEFSGVPLEQLALFWRGDEQPVHIVDHDNSGTFNIDDTLWFRGRRPTGDTTWLDRYDTVAVFMLTTRLDGLRKRYEPLKNDGVGVSIDRLGYLDVHQRLELDTGHYHLGNSLDFRLSDYNSHWAIGEGYYWHRLVAQNTNGSTQKITIPVWCIPAPGRPLRITAEMLSTTDIQDNPPIPDNRADVALNGRDVSYFEEDGFGQRLIEKELGQGNNAHGLQHISIYGTGLANRFSEPGYFSETLLDAVLIDGSVQPVLDNGRLNASLPALPTASIVTIQNARSPYVHILDTTDSRFSKVPALRRGTMVTVGMTPVDLKWPTIEWDQISHRAYVRIDNLDTDIPAVNGLTLVIRRPGQNSEAITGITASAAVAAIKGAPQGTLLVMIATPLRSTAELADAIDNVLHIRPENFGYIAAGVVGGNGTLSATNGSSIGLTAFFESSTQNSSYSSDVWFDNGSVRALYIADASGVEHARVERSNLMNLRKDKQQVDYIFVTHAIHRQHAQRLADYRRTSDNLTTRVVDIAAINDEFGGGTQSPEALKEYLHYVWEHSPDPKPRYALLVGNASWDPRLAVKQGNAGSTLPNQIISYGRPSSDYWYGLLDDYEDARMPEMIIARLPVITEQQARIVVDKIILMDTIAFEPWMRRWMFIGGGSELEGLCTIFQDLLYDTFGTGITFHDAPLCLDTLTLCKYTTGTEAGYKIKTALNGGLQWMNFIGHGATTQFDITGFNADELQNPNKYGILATYACQTGAFSNPSLPCKNSEYLTAEGKGTVAAIGGTGWEFQQNISMLHFKMHELPRNGERQLGQIVYNAKLSLNIDRRPGFISEGYNSVMQYSILGDPFTRLKMDTIPDVYVRRMDVQIRTETGKSDITTDDSTITVTIDLQNAGIGTKQPFPVRLYHSFNGGMDSADVLLEDGICKSAVVFKRLATHQIPGEHTIRILIDPGQFIHDNPRGNTLTTTFTVYERTIQPLIPHANGYLYSNSPFVRVLDPLFEVNGRQLAHFVVSREKSTNNGVVWASQISEIHYDNSIIDWQPAVSNIASGYYWLGTWVETQSSGMPISVLWLPIRVVSTDEHAGTHAVEQPGSRVSHITPEHVQIDTNANSVTLKSIDADLYVVSSSKKTDNLEKDPIAVVKINEITYLYTGYNRGINVVVVPPGDTIPSKVRWYDTWQDPNPRETPDLNGYGPELVKFIYDSIAPGDLVIMLACDESFTALIRDNLMDTFRRAVTDMGSRYADSLRRDASWILVGMKGLGKGNGKEMWAPDGAPQPLLRMYTKFPVLAQKATVVSDWFGPMRKFIGSSVAVLNDSASSYLEVRNPDGMAQVVDTLPNNEWTSFDLPSSTRYVRIRTELKRKSPGDTIAPILKTASVRYEPADEWLIAPDGLSVDTQGVLRGDTVPVVVSIRNARTDQRTEEGTFELSTTMLEGQGPLVISGEIPSIGQDQIHKESIAIPTGNLANVSVVKVEVNPGQTRAESYIFNNVRTASLPVGEDTTAPTITIVADGDTIQNNDFVLPKPKFEVLLSDNSRLPIADEARLSVLVNGVKIKSSSADNYVFIPTASIRDKYTLPNIRAAVTFEYMLESGQNNILVRSADASGIATNIEVSVWVASTSKLNEVTASPNPATGPITFMVNLADTVAQRMANLVVYDAQGREVHRGALQLDLGKSNYVWTPVSAENTSISSGIYFYRLYLEGATEGGENTRSGHVVILH